MKRSDYVNLLVMGTAAAAVGLLTYSLARPNCGPADAPQKPGDAATARCGSSSGGGGGHGWGFSSGGGSGQSTADAGTSRGGFGSSGRGGGGGE